jgi:uncharacterized protein
MAKRLIVRGEEAEIIVELAEGPVANELWDRLPLETRATLRGEELYFPVLLPTATEAPESKAVEVGDVAYWPPENAICLFCGDSHARTDKHDPVTPVGRIIGGMEDCGLVRQNETLRIEASEG